MARFLYPSLFQLADAYGNEFTYHLVQNYTNAIAGSDNQPIGPQMKKNSILLFMIDYTTMPRVVKGQAKKIELNHMCKLADVLR